jgi:hypothetical protein
MQGICLLTRGTSFGIKVLRENLLHGNVWEFPPFFTPLLWADIYNILVKNGCKNLLVFWERSDNLNQTAYVETDEPG